MQHSLKKWSKQEGSKSGANRNGRVNPQTEIQNTGRQQTINNPKTVQSAKQNKETGNRGNAQYVLNMK